jgi:hypothetical protein
MGSGIDGKEMIVIRRYFSVMGIVSPFSSVIKLFFPCSGVIQKRKIKSKKIVDKPKNG